MSKRIDEEIELSEDDLDTVLKIAKALKDRDWHAYASAVAEGPEVAPVGIANHAIRLLAFESIQKLKHERQSNHLAAITDLSMQSERELMP